MDTIYAVMCEDPPSGDKPYVVVKTTYRVDAGVVTRVLTCYEDRAEAVSIVKELNDLYEELCRWSQRARERRT